MMAASGSMVGLEFRSDVAKRGRQLRENKAPRCNMFGCGNRLRIPTHDRRSYRVSVRAGRTPAQEWVGLPHWRTKPMDELRVWGKRDQPTYARDEPWEGIAAMEQSCAKQLQHWERLQQAEAKVDALDVDATCSSLAKWGAVVLAAADPLEKAVLTHHAYRLWCRGALPLGVAVAPDSPARPAKPELVHPRKIPPPGAMLPPSAHALHNLAHIELNAIDLAWDTVVRFSSASRELHPQFFADFAHVADDESRHCLWCLQRIAELGFSYGDMPAHNLLMVDCQKSSGSVMARLAMIPMIQEARGLDAGPRLFEKLMVSGDVRSASMIKRIAEEEVAHVAVGVAWFVDVCKRLGVDPAERFQGLMIEGDLELRGPFNHPERLLAGLPRDWYDTSYNSTSPNDADDASDSTYSKVVKRSSTVIPKDHSLSSPFLLPNYQLLQQVGQAASDQENGDSLNKSNSRLSEVYDRLATVVVMEQGNADA